MRIVPIRGHVRINWLEPPGGDPLRDGDIHYPLSAVATARIGGVGLQTVRDWVLRFNARGPDGFVDDKAPSKKPKLNNTQRSGSGTISASESPSRELRTMGLSEAACQGITPKTRTPWKIMSIGMRKWAPG